MPMQVARTRIQLPADAEISAWRAEFDERHGIRMPQLIEPRLLEWIRGRLAVAPFHEFVHPIDPPAIELVMDDGVLHVILNALFNDARFFDVVRRMTGCDAPGCYSARVYAMDPSSHHRDSWHDDADGNRMVAMSVNVGDPFEGGVLCVRDESGVVREFPNTGAGDAILFRIRKGLKHVVTPVTGHVRKMAIAGWFQREPTAKALLLEPDPQ